MNFYVHFSSNFFPIPCHYGTECVLFTLCKIYPVWILFLEVCLISLSPIQKSVFNIITSSTLFMLMTQKLELILSPICDHNKSMLFLPFTYRKLVLTIINVEKMSYKKHFMMSDMWQSTFHLQISKLNLVWNQFQPNVLSHLYFQSLEKWARRIIWAQEFETGITGQHKEALSPQNRLTKKKKKKWANSRTIEQPQVKKNVFHIILSE